MPVSTQKLLIRQSKALGFRGNNDNSAGMCHGISCMVAQEILAGNFSALNKNIINLLTTYKDHKKLLKDIEAVKQKVKDKIELNGKDIEIFEIMAFLEGTELYQQPGKYNTLLASNALQHQSFLDILPILAPIALASETPNISLIQQYTNIYDAKKLKQMLLDLENILSRNLTPIPILISANNHAIVIYYDKQNGWIFIDPNQLPFQKINETKILANKVMTSFNLKGLKHEKLAINFNLFVAKKVDYKFKKKLDDLSKKQIKSISAITSSVILPHLQSKYHSLLNLATSEGNLPVVKKILKNNVEDSAISEAIRFAIEFNQPSVFKELFKYLQPNDIEQTRMINNACEKGRETIVRCLINLNPALINRSSDESKTSPLHIAITHDRQAIAMVLLEQGADIEAKDYENMTPLLKAAAKGNLTGVKLLIENKANTSVKDNHDNTLLTHAALSGNLKLVKYILKKAKPNNLNPVNKIGVDLIKSLLTDILREKKYCIIAEYLLSKGAKLNNDQRAQLRTSYHLTISHNKAQKLGHQHIANLLLPIKEKNLKQHSLFKATIKEQKILSTAKQNHTSQAEAYLGGYKIGAKPKK